MDMGQFLKDVPSGLWGVLGIVLGFLLNMWRESGANARAQTQADADRTERKELLANERTDRAIADERAERERNAVIRAQEEKDWRNFRLPRHEACMAAAHQYGEALRAAYSKQTSEAKDELHRALAACQTATWVLEIFAGDGVRGAANEMLIQIRDSYKKFMDFDRTNPNHEERTSADRDYAQGLLNDAAEKVAVTSIAFAKASADELNVPTPHADAATQQAHCP